ncbi:hypothetical protein TNCV_4894661 [Trichonephila clavipes]|nr:hypothetical protein TNCV_4894661 [Trichonephila clavipes]
MGSHVFSLTCPLGSLGPELKATLLQPNPRNPDGSPSSSFIPTPLAHADNQRDGHSSGVTSHSGLEAEICPASGVCPESWRLSCVRDITSGLEADFWPTSGCLGGKTVPCVMIVQSPVAKHCLVSDVCPVAWNQNSVLRRVCPEPKWLNSVQRHWQNSVLQQGYVKCPGGSNLLSVRCMSSVLEAHLCPDSGVCLVAWRQNSALRQCVQVAALCPVPGVCPVAWRHNWFLRRVGPEPKWLHSVQHQGYNQYPSCRTLSNIRGMSCALEALICLASGVCVVSVRQKSVLRQGYVQYLGGKAWRQNSEQPKGYVHWPGGRDLSSVRSISRGMEARLFPASGVCTVSGWVNSFQRQGFVHSAGGRTLSCVRGRSSTLDSELYPFSGVCPKSGWQNSVQSQGYFQRTGGRTLSSVKGISSVRELEICPSSKVCPVAFRHNSFLRQGDVQCPRGRTMSCVSGMPSNLEGKLFFCVSGMPSYLDQSSV